MFRLFSLVSLLPEGSKAFVAGLHPEMLRAWLDTLAQTPHEEAAGAMQKQLKRVSALTNLRARLQMLDIIAEEAVRLAGMLDAELNEAHHPLAAELQRKVVAGNELLKLHAGCYRKVADTLSGSWIGRGRPQHLLHALVQAMELERRRLILAFRAYAPGSKSAWRNLHQLHRIARANGCAGAAPAGSADSPDRIYIKTLLLAFAEPVRMAPGELERIRFYLDRHAGLAELGDAAGSAREADDRMGCFLIRQREQGPGRSLQKWHKVETLDGDLLLDCGPFLKNLRSQIDAIAHGALPSKVGLPAAARRPQYLAMMHNLLMLWSAPPTRRYSRQRFKPRIELAAGLDDLWSLLSDLALRRRSGDPPPGAAASAGPELSEWSVINESPAGFALQYLSGESDGLSVGALAGLRSQERSTVHICLVRRLVSGEQRRAELGLQKYAPFAVPTTIVWSGTAGENRAPARAIVLPRVPSLDGAAAVIVAPGLLRLGKRVPFRLNGKNMTLVAGTPIERNDAYEIFSLSNPGN